MPSGGFLQAYKSSSHHVYPIAKINLNTASGLFGEAEDLVRVIGCAN